MEEIRDQLTSWGNGTSSKSLQGFIRTRWLFWIFWTINSRRPQSIRDEDQESECFEVSFLWKATHHPSPSKGNVSRQPVLFYTTMTNLILPSQKQVPKCFESSSIEIIISATHQRTLILTPKIIQKLVKGNTKTTSTTINIHKSHQNAQPNAASVTGRSLARSQGPTKRLGWKRRHLNQLHHVQDG